MIYYNIAKSFWIHLWIFVDNVKQLGTFSNEDGDADGKEQ